MSTDIVIWYHDFARGGGIDDNVEWWWLSRDCRASLTVRRVNLFWLFQVLGKWESRAWNESNLDLLSKEINYDFCLFLFLFIISSIIKIYQSHDTNSAVQTSNACFSDQGKCKW